MEALIHEVARFREWSTDQTHFGEWECDYRHWGDLHEAVSEFLRVRPFASWSADELDAVLFTVARDNEIQHLARQLRKHHAEVLIPLAAAAIELAEMDAKWQLAQELGRLGQAGGEVERLLLLLAQDEAEYVRRKSLEALARLGAPATAERALLEWHRPNENQQWARMMALWCLHRVGSTYLPPLLDDAEQDERPYLSAYARRVRKSDVDA